MKSILFVCTGNTCRSPLAEGLFLHMLKCDDQFKASSAGLHTVKGLPASSYTIEVLIKHGIDFSLFRSQPVSRCLIEESTHVFAMTHGHLRELLILYPEHQKKFFLLNEGTTQEDIVDPIGGNLLTYQECSLSIQRALENIIMMIKKNIL